MQKYTLIESESYEKGDKIAFNLTTKETVLLGKYKSGENELKGKYKPEYSKQRMVIYGKAGSGKTHYASFIISSYHKQYPKNDIFFISPHNKEDEKPLAKQIAFIKQMEIPDSPDPIDATKEFKNCLVFIDDIKGFKTRDQNNFVLKVAKDLYYNCRKYGVSVIVTNHELLDGWFNKLFNYEAEQVTFFPSSLLAMRQVNTYCDKYLGLGQSEMEYIKNSNSRWITVNSAIPQYIMTETGIKML